MKRLFVAIKISEKLQAEIAKWKQGFPDLPVRWLLAENLHITLVPPWQETDIFKVKDDLKKIQNQIKPFEINFNKVSFGPKERDPRLIWATGQAPGEIIKLERAVLEALSQSQANKRPFTLHLTLARLDKLARLARFKPWQLSGFKNKNLDEKINWQDQVEGIELIESVLLPQGAKYITLGKIKLSK